MFFLSYGYVLFSHVCDFAHAITWNMHRHMYTWQVRYLPGIELGSLVEAAGADAVVGSSYKFDRFAEFKQHGLGLPFTAF